MFTPKPIRQAAAVCVLIVATSGAFAQEAPEVGSERDRVSTMAERIATVMQGLEDRAETYPQFITDLQDGVATIEQADEQVAELISQLQIATDQMDDNSEFDTAIDDYKAATVALIAEAEASPLEVVKSAIPDLEVSLSELEALDQRRAETVVEARNLIRVLEQNREAIAFFIKANQVQRATDVIQSNLDEFEQIVDDGKNLASDLMDAANP